MSGQDRSKNMGKNIVNGGVGGRRGQGIILLPSLDVIIMYSN